MMEILVCIDDTDNLDSPGTGHLAESLRHDIEEIFNGTTSRITRHQLFVSDDIPYTSHNSTMCFSARIDPGSLSGVIKLAADFLREKSAPGSDPGLCVAVVDNLRDRDRLIQFGRDATRKVLVKSMAMSLAEELNIHLSEHGGTGGGIIGALAGVGLRLGGNNGRFKGKIEIEEKDRSTRAGVMCKKYSISRVVTREGRELSPDTEIKLGEKIKTVLIGGEEVLVVKEETGGEAWTNLDMEEIRCY